MQTQAGKTPAIAPYEARFSNLRLPDGTRLRYVQQGSVTSRPIVMLHGYTDSSFSFSRVLPLLPPNLHVLVPDQRGHGDSDRPEDGYTIEVLARDVLDLLDALQLEPAVVVGHSMGTFVARQMAALAPPRVSRLVLVAPGPGPNDVLLELSAAVQQLTDPVDPAFVREFQASTVHRPVPPEFMDLIVRESLKVPVHIWRAALAGLLAYEPIETFVTCPTLVIGGDRDSVFSAAEHEAVAEAIAGARVHRLEEIGHTPHWEDPRTFVATLLAELA